VHPFDLARGKHTRRLADYETIESLAELEHERRPSPATWRWALENSW
jgi:hypothetical protein